jgi:hypothetical protein
MTDLRDIRVEAWHSARSATIPSLVPYRTVLSVHNTVVCSLAGLVQILTNKFMYVQ